MGLIGFGLLVLIAYGAIRLIARGIAWLAGSNYRAFRRLASHYGGRYETRGLSDSPIVSFPDGEDLVRVGLAPASPRLPGVVSTRVVVRFRRGIPFRMELTPRASSWTRMAPKGTQIVPSGDREFDGAFQVQANDPEMARDVLGPAARWSIHGLQRLAPPGGVMMAVSPERLLVQLDRNLGDDAEALLAAVEETLAVVQALREGVEKRISEGVTLLEVGGPVELPEAPICKVCGEPVARDAGVVCDKCGAPHHRDCWEFVGWCSIYGCGGKTNRQPARPPLHPSEAGRPGVA